MSDIGHSSGPHTDHGGADHGSNVDYGVRASAGISFILYVFMAASLVVIFWQGGNVISSARSGHIWPAASAAKVDLPPAHT